MTISIDIKSQKEQIKAKQQISGRESWHFWENLKQEVAIKWRIS